MGTPVNECDQVIAESGETKPGYSASKKLLHGSDAEEENGQSEIAVKETIEQPEGGNEIQEIKEKSSITVHN